jgi:hypothetical protein
MTQLTPAEMFLGRKPRTLLSLLSPLAGMDKRVVQKQAKVTMGKTKITRSFLPGDLVWVQCLVHNLVWKEGEIVNPVVTDLPSFGSITFLWLSHSKYHSCWCSSAAISL